MHLFNATIVLGRRYYYSHFIEWEAKSQKERKEGRREGGEKGKERGKEERFSGRRELHCLRTFVPIKTCLLQ